MSVRAGCRLAAAVALAGAAVDADARPTPAAAVIDRPPTELAIAGARVRRAIGPTRPVARAGLDGWRERVDTDTGVPLRWWGPGVPAPGAIAGPGRAEAAARGFLASHLAILAPGARFDDFVVVSNRVSRRGDVRSVGFAQRAGGLRVLGGAIGISFKADRLVVVASTALPHVTVDAVRAAPTGERVILPIVRSRPGAGADIRYRVVVQAPITAGDGPAREIVWLDATTGSPIARTSTIMSAGGTVGFDVPDRGPLGARHARPAPFANVVVDGAAAVTDGDGAFAWSGDAGATIALSPVGAFVAVASGAGPVATESLLVPADGAVVWSRASEELADAQLSAYVYANQVKQLARTRIVPGFAYLDRQLAITVNEQGMCNAFSTGDDLHFFRGSPACENTARIADIVYHEFGHSLHVQSIIPGVGQFDGAVSEALADTLAVLMTGDPGVGRGFFHNDLPLRSLDPAVPKRWPTDVIGEVHADGEILGGALWDLRRALTSELGSTAGDERFIDIYYGIMQRASDLPSSFVEALIADDDDGDLADGTPNECAIVDAFARHGLADATVTRSLAPPRRDGMQLTLAVPPRRSDACRGVPDVTEVTAEWRLRGGEPSGSVVFSSGDAGHVGTLPEAPPGSVVQYRVTARFSDGTTVRFPRNVAAPWYELYAGAVTPLWCDDFETGAPGWSHGGTGDDWQVGMPLGRAGDPAAAAGGAQAFGTDLSDDGAYAPRAATYAETPAIDVPAGARPRLQYRRWLAVEDGFYDGAAIVANGDVVWRNTASSARGGFDHVDREWQFHDVDLGGDAGGPLRLRFELTSDDGRELGGWAIDDVCVVVAPATPEASGGGCTAAGGDRGLALALGVLGLAMRRRRRRAGAGSRVRAEREADPIGDRPWIAPAFPRPWCRRDPMIKIAIVSLVTMLGVMALQSSDQSQAPSEAAEAAHCTFWMCGPGTCVPEQEICYPTRLVCLAECPNPASCHPVDVCQ